MYHVSLLPYEYRMLHLSARKKNLGHLAAIVVMGVLFVAYLILTVSAASKDSELKGLRAENQMIEAQIAQIQDIDVIYNQVNSLLEQVSAAYGTNPDWKTLLARVGNSVPETVSLSNIDLVYEGDKKECVIQGAASDYGSVSGWIIELTQIESFENVRCRFSTQKDESADTPVEFELYISLLPGSGYIIPLEANRYE